MKSYLTSISFFLITLSSFCQKEPLNLCDSTGKKHGKWIVYLDEKWNTTDSADAIFFRFTWYDHGINIHPMGKGGDKMETATDTSAQTGKMKILDGEYRWYENGTIKYIHVLKKGEYISYKEFNKNGDPVSHFDYTKGCKEQPHSWTIITYDKKGRIKLSFPVCKDKNGNWPKMRG